MRRTSWMTSRSFPRRAARFLNGWRARRCRVWPRCPVRNGRTLARITLRQLLDHAAEHSYGVPAFNINNMEQGLAIMEAAEAVDAPVLIQASRGARHYSNDIVLKHLIEAPAEIYPPPPTPHPNY